MNDDSLAIAAEIGESCLRLGILLRKLSPMAHHFSAHPAEVVLDFETVEDAAQFLVEFASPFECSRCAGGIKPGRKS